MTNHERDRAAQVVRPGERDIAIAAEEIIKAIGSRAMPTENLFDVVGRRLAAEPLPEAAAGFEGVREGEIRRVRSATTTVTAIAFLEARGDILPLAGGELPARQWNVAYQYGGTSGGYNVDAGYNYRLAPAYRLASVVVLPADIGSPAVFLADPPASMAPKVRRVLREAVDVYRAGRSFAAAVLLGVASEAAWGQLARAVARKTNSAALRKLLDSPFTNVGEIHERTVNVIRAQDLKGVDLAAIDALEQIYRDLRNYAAHRPDETFDEARVARWRVGTLLDGSVDYFRRLYDLMDKINAMP